MSVQTYNCSGYGMSDGRRLGAYVKTEDYRKLEAECERLKAFIAKCDKELADMISKSHAPDCAITLNGRHGCSCGRVKG